jgi:hypothetical protein
MSHLRRFCALALLGCAFVPAQAAFQKPAQTQAQAPPILPPEFGGWQMQGAAQTSADSSSVDPTNAAALKEYGFSDAALSTYTRDDGRTLKIRAARFADASGAFGAYTFYLQPEMVREKIGDQGASQGQRVLFYRGHILVDALFSKESPMSGAELRELAGLVPRPAGSAGSLPPVLGFMPQRSYVANTQKYAMGPVALGAFQSSLASDVVDFGADAEVSLGKYSTDSGTATLMLIYYPNPQVAIEHLRRIDAARALRPQGGDVSTTENAGPFFDKRTGPIIAIASGPLSESDAKSLLAQVHWEANLTWSQRTFLDPNNDLGGFLVNVILACFILGALAIVAGVAFGGIRILMKRLFPGRVFDRPEQMEFISLHLAETVAAGPDSGRAAGGFGEVKTPPSVG